MIQAISTPDAPSPHGHYSQGILAGPMLFISALLPKPAQGGAAALSLEEQVRSVLDSIAAITRKAGGDVGNIVRVTFYVSNLEDWGRVNQAYAQFMGDHKPARGVLAVASLKDGWQVSADAVAYLG